MRERAKDQTAKIRIELAPAAAANPPSRGESGAAKSSERGPRPRREIRFFGLWDAELPL